MPIADVIQGHKFASAFAKQSAPGTPATNPEYQTPAYAGIVKPEESRTEHEVLDGAAFRPGEFKDKAWGGGTVTFQSFPDSIGRLLAGHLGSDTMTGAGADKTHTIVNNNSPQWMTFWTQRPLTGASVEWDRFTDCVIKSLELQYSAGNLFRAQCEVMARVGRVAVAAPTPAVVNVLDAVGPWHTWADAVLKLDLATTPAATTIANLQSFVIHMGYDSLDLLQTQHLTPDFRDIGLWTLTMSADFIVQDWAAFKATYFGSPTASDTDQSATIPAGSLDFLVHTGPTLDALKSVQFKMPSVTYSLAAPDPDVSGAGLKATLTGKLQKPASGAPFTGIVLNQVSTAY